jgi:DNA-directed RNA polymerase subunit F
MVENKIDKKETLSFPELAKIIQGTGKKEDRAEIQNKVLEFAKKSSKLSEKDAEKLIEELKGLNIPMITEELVVQIANFLPSDLSELKTTFAGAKVNISPENFKRIHELIKGYKKEK